MLLVEQLQKRLGRFVLRVDRLEIPSGCYFLLLGPSGSGKTVLLETLAGLNQPEQGRVLLEGRDITHEPPERRGVGFVYQRAWLFPHLTVEENIRFGLRCQSRGSDSAENDRRVRELIELLGIGHLADRLPRKLSGGESQRVAMARALAIRPRLLFLDEPLGPLDPVAREALARELLSWHRRFSTTTVHVTHDHLEARMLADHVGIVMDGRLAQAGPTEEVFGRPAQRRVAGFVGSENIWDGTLTQGESVDPTPRVIVGKLMLRPSAGVAALLGGAAARPVAVCVRPENIRLLEPSLIGGTSADTSSADTSSADTSSADTSSADTSSADTSSADTSSADTSSADTSSADTYTACAPRENRLTGRVTELSDRGPMVRLCVESTGTMFVAYESRAEARRRGRAVGSEVGLVFEDEAVHVMES